MNVLSRLFALCAIGTLIVVATIGNSGGWSFGLIVTGTLIASAFGALSGWFNSMGSRVAQRPVDTMAQDILREVRQGKRPRFHLYLRPFNITNRARVTNSKRSPDLFDLTHYEQTGSTDFESILEDASSLPLIALGRPGEALGAGRISTTDESWWEIFLLLAEAAEKLFVVPSDKSGTMREIEWIKANGNLKKSIFVCPPSGGRIQSDWDRAASQLGIQLAVYSSGGKLFMVDDSGQLIREVSIDANTRIAVSNAISSVEGVPVNQVGVPPVALDETSLRSFSNYKEQRPMNGFLKFVLIVLAGMVVEFVLNILKS
jgi:hypothetical protein